MFLRGIPTPLAQHSLHKIVNKSFSEVRVWEEQENCCLNNREI